MTIHLPEPLEKSIVAAVHSGRFASVDDAMAEAASLLVERLKHEESQRAKPQAQDRAEASPAYEPIWEVADELRKIVPPKEWAHLPVDGAAQHDHYIYGLRKRPAS